MTKTVTLGKFLIQKINNDNYRAGRLCGSKHPKVDNAMIIAVGDLKELLLQAAELEAKGLIGVKWTSMKSDIEQLDVPVENIPKLCQLEGIEDPRKKQWWISLRDKAVGAKSG